MYLPTERERERDGLDIETGGKKTRYPIRVFSIIAYKVNKSKYNNQPGVNIVV